MGDISFNSGGSASGPNEITPPQADPPAGLWQPTNKAQFVTVTMKATILELKNELANPQSYLPSLVSQAQILKTMLVNSGPLIYPYGPSTGLDPTTNIGNAVTNLTNFINDLSKNPPFLSDAKVAINGVDGALILPSNETYDWPAAQTSNQLISALGVLLSSNVEDISKNLANGTYSASKSIATLYSLFNELVAPLEQAPNTSKQDNYFVAMVKQLSDFFALFASSGSANTYHTINTSGTDQESKNALSSFSYILSTGCLSDIIDQATNNIAAESTSPLLPSNWNPETTNMPKIGSGSTIEGPNSSSNESSGFNGLYYWVHDKANKGKSLPTKTLDSFIETFLLAAPFSQAGNLKNLNEIELVSTYMQIIGLISNPSNSPYLTNGESLPGSTPSASLFDILGSPHPYPGSGMIKLFNNIFS
ncbi:MAG: hypothetical protein MRY21_07510 [Simkaniaceae bacterium]|nr:hypothetical protein [Simkaniaceae bacterium]